MQVLFYSQSLCALHLVGPVALSYEERITACEYMCACKYLLFRCLSIASLSKGIDTE